MTQPPGGWSSPGGPAPEPPPAYGYGYGTPPPPPPPGQPPPPPTAPPWAQPGWGQPGFGAPQVTPGVVPLRPLTLGELLDGAVKVVRRYPRPTLGMSGLLAIVTTLLNVLAVLAQDYSSFAEDVTGSSSASTDTNVNGSLASIPANVVGLLAGIVLTGFLVAVVGKAVLGHPTTFAEVWRQVRGRILALVGLALLTGLLSFGALALGIGLAVLLGFLSPWLLFLGIPLAIGAAGLGVYLYVRLSLAPAVLVLERSGIRTAMRRSGVLVKGDWWRVFGILLLVQVIAAFVSSVLTVPFLLVAGINAVANPDAGSFTLLFVVSQIGGGVATLLVAPFAAAARGLLYVDRRMRAEGLDLSLQAAARA
jgi:MFS family permease